MHASICGILQSGMSGGSMGGYGAAGGGSTADAQWRSPAPASSSASAPTAQGSSKRTWSGQVRVIVESTHANL